MEEQQKLEKHGRKGKQVIENGLPYPPINITNNVLSPNSSAIESETATPQKADSHLTASSPLDIPGPRDEAVKEYSMWQMSNVTDGTLKASFRQVCDVMIENGLDLDQVYKDQDPNFFISKGIKIGIARRFVEDIRCWVDNVKRVIPICEVD